MDDPDMIPFSSVLSNLDWLSYFLEVVDGDGEAVNLPKKLSDPLTSECSLLRPNLNLSKVDWFLSIFLVGVCLGVVFYETFLEFD